VPTFLKSALRVEIFLKICDCSSKNAEIRSKTAILGGLKCEKSRAKAVFCGLLGAVFHRETPGVSCVKRPVDQIEMGGAYSFFTFFWMSRFVECTSFCSKRIRSSNNSFEGKASLMRMLL
jgi:hypothetical protein